MLSAVTAVALGILPGGLLGLALPRGMLRWAAWASSPILSLGLTSVPMAWLPVFGLPRSARWVLAAELIVAVLAVAAAHLPRARAPRRDGPMLPPRADLVCAGVAGAVALGLGQLLLGRLSAPPGWDGMNHALMTRNIMVTGSTAITSACTTGSTHPVVSCTFYPLATDTSWAQAATVSGGHVSSAMTAWAAVVGPLFLVLAVYVAARVLGARPVVAGAAATATVLLGPVWESMLTGRVPEQVAPGLSVGVALLAALAMTGPHPVRAGCIAGLGFAGLAMTHTYDVLFAATLAVAFVVVRRSSANRRRLVGGSAATVATSVLAVLPLGSAMLSAGATRSAAPPEFMGHVGRALLYWVVNPERYVLLGWPAPLGGTVQLHVLSVQVGLVLTLPCLLASALCFRFAELTWARPWFVMWAVWTSIGIWTSVSGSGPSRSLAALWYGTPSRLATMILPVYGVLTVAGGVGIAMLVQRKSGWLPSRLRSLRSSPRSVPIAAVALVSALAILALVPSTWRPLRHDLARRTPIGSSYPHVFQWLAAHTPKGAVVAYDRHLEMMTWSYADYGVPLLFGIPPLVQANKHDYAQRFEAWGWLVNNPHAAPAGCLVRKYGVVYVVVGQQRMPGIIADYVPARLADSPRLTVAHRDGALTVYAVNAAGSACPTLSHTAISRPQ